MSSALKRQLLLKMVHAADNLWCFRQTLDVLESRTLSLCGHSKTVYFKIELNYYSVVHMYNSLRSKVNYFYFSPFNNPLVLILKLCVCTCVYF